MKKIRCVRDGKDFLKLVPSDIANDEWFITMNPEACEVVLDARAIRKLRKQLKRALIEIEGEKKEDDWFSVGRTVKIIANTSNHYFPIGVNVKLIEEESSEIMRAEYLDGHDYWLVNKNDCEPAS